MTVNLCSGHTCQVCSPFQYARISIQIIIEVLDYHNVKENNFFPVHRLDKVMRCCIPLTRLLKICIRIPLDASFSLGTNVWRATFPTNYKTAPFKRHI